MCVWCAEAGGIAIKYVNVIYANRVKKALSDMIDPDVFVIYNSKKKTKKMSLYWLFQATLGRVMAFNPRDSLICLLLRVLVMARLPMVYVQHIHVSWDTMVELSPVWLIAHGALWIAQVPYIYNIDISNTSFYDVLILYFFNSCLTVLKTLHHCISVDILYDCKRNISYMDGH